MYNQHTMMKRVDYHLTEKQIVALKTLSRETGLSVAEHIRRAVDGYLNEKNVQVQSQNQ